MAYVALISLLRTLDQIPQPFQQIKPLQEKVSRLLVILEDFLRKNCSLSISHLEEQIRDALYEAEDIIESHEPREVVPKSISCGVISRCFGEVISSLIPSIHLREESFEFQGLEKIINEFDSILEDLSKIKEEEVEDRQSKNSSIVGSSRIERSNLVGLDDDLLQIKDRLIGSPSKLDIISIVGMGGIGKTTLARNLYNDSIIEHHFDSCAWEVVSQEYHLQEMLSSILDSTIGGEFHDKSIQQLAEALHESLKGKRFLIVMDDIWDIKAWDDVKRFFPDDKNRSRIILTTHIEYVAIYANSYSSIHHMGLLSPEARWDLLRERYLGRKAALLD